MGGNVAKEERIPRKTPKFTCLGSARVSGGVFSVSPNIGHWIRSTDRSLSRRIREDCSRCSHRAAWWRWPDGEAAVIIDSRRLAGWSWLHNARAGANSWKRSCALHELNMSDLCAASRAHFGVLELSPGRELEILEELSQHLE